MKSRIIIMEEKELYRLLGFVKISNYRTNILKSINKSVKMPSEIANELGIKTSKVSATLYFLKKEGLVICLNEDVRKGRLYKCTDKAIELLEYL